MLITKSLLSILRLKQSVFIRFSTQLIVTSARFTVTTVWFMRTMTKVLQDNVLGSVSPGSRSLVLWLWNSVQLPWFCKTMGMVLQDERVGSARRSIRYYKTQLKHKNVNKITPMSNYWLLCTSLDGWNASAKHTHTDSPSDQGSKNDKMDRNVPIVL